MLTDDHYLAFLDRIGEEVRPVRWSQYDISDRCNLKCEGCLYFAGNDRDGHPETDDPEQLDRFFADEARRGINYAQFAGAEPSLAQDKIRIAARYIRRGFIVTNGTVRLAADLPFRIHVSLWGLPEDSKRFRGADVVRKALKNYRGDHRAIFVFTINAQNVEHLPAVVALCADNGVKVTFNHYSPTHAYGEWLKTSGDTADYFRFADPQAGLVLTPASLARSRELIAQLIDSHPNTVVFTHAYNDWIHNPAGLYDVDSDTGIANSCGARVTPRNRHYRADMRDAGRVKCCAANIDCNSCRLYLQSIATYLYRLMPRHGEPTAPKVLAEAWDLWCRVLLVGWDGALDESMQPARIDVAEGSALGR